MFNRLYVRPKFCRIAKLAKLWCSSLCRTLQYVVKLIIGWMYAISFVQMDYPLVFASSELQHQVFLFLDERPVHKNVYA